MNAIITLLLLLLSFNSFAIDAVAHVDSLKGDVWVQDVADQRRLLKKGDPLYEFETVITGPKAQVLLIFTDKSKFNLADNTIFEISQYQYLKNNTNNTFSSRIIKGTFRFFTGLIAGETPSAMKVNLPVATIGIRGTHVIGEASHDYAKVIMLKPDKPKKTAVEVYNQFGSVIIDKAGYGTEVPDEFSPPSPVRRMQMRTIDNLMRSIQSTQRIRPPRLR